MKKLVLIFFLININLLAQFKITFTDHSITDAGDIILKVLAQNLGNDERIWAVYGPNFYDRLGEMQSNFMLNYVDIMNDNKVRERIPSSIVIKTIFDTYISMDTPNYYFSSTGGSAAEEWHITFTDIPMNAGTVYVEVLGTEISLGDMPKADETRKMKEKILKEALYDALEASKNKLWEKAATHWEEAIQLSSKIVNDYNEQISIAYCEKAKLLIRQNDFISAIDYFEKAKKYDEQIFNNYRDVYANLQYEYGEKLINDKDINAAVESFKYSYSLSEINRMKIENKLDEMKQNRFTSITLSIIPGLSQLILQKNTTKSLLLFVAFGASSALTVTTKMDADNLYDEYLNATTPEVAEAKYEQADEKIKEVGLFLGLTAVTVIYSIIDQFVETSRYNSLFEIAPILSSNYYGSNNYCVTLLINISF